MVRRGVPAEDEEEEGSEETREGDPLRGGEGAPRVFQGAQEETPVFVAAEVFQEETDDRVVEDVECQHRSRGFLLSLQVEGVEDEKVQEVEDRLYQLAGEEMNMEGSSALFEGYRVCEDNAQGACGGPTEATARAETAQASEGVA